MIHYLAVGTFLFITTVVAQTTTYLDVPRKFLGPQTYKDASTGIIFYVESDGRHISAISKDGKILWHRDPFVDSKLEAYRVKHPVIVWIGEMDRNGNKQLEITFNSSQFGSLDRSTGDFTFLGQD